MRTRSTLRYLYKPWDAQQLRETLATAADVARRLQQQSAPVAAQVAAPSRCKLLVLDADEQTARMVKEVILDSHDVSWAPNLPAALECLAHEAVAVVVTSFKDTQKVAELINQAQVFRYLPKPVSRGMLARSLEFSIARHQRMLATPALLECQTTAAIADAAERTVASRIGEYLQRLRTRTFSSKGNPASTAH